MRTKPYQRLFAVCLNIAFLVSLCFIGSVDAGSRGGFRSSSSFSRSSSSYSSSGHSWSPRTHDTWNRNGGGFFGSGEKSSGYSKPVQTPKPPTSEAPRSSGNSPSGYSKPIPDSGRSSGGYTKPVPHTGEASSPSSSAPLSSSRGYAKPTTAPTGAQSFQGGSRFDTETIKGGGKKASQQSLEKYKTDQSTFAKPAYRGDGMFSGPLADKAKTTSGFDYRNYHDRRDSYYRSQGYQPPNYVFNSSPSFGMFNTIFLFWMLDHISNKNVAKTAYNHSDDPGFQKWRQDAENIAKDNSELRSKLTEMDKQIEALKGTPKDPAYLPPGVPPEAALAPALFAAREGQKPVLRFAGAQTGGWYGKYIKLFEKNCTAMVIKTIPSSGSLQNLRLLANGEADVALVQSDVLALRERVPGEKEFVTEQTTLFLEYIQLLANRDGGVKSLKDLDPAKHEIYVGPKGSGTSQTWQSLCQIDPALARIRTKNTDYYEALSKVEKDTHSLMLFVGGLKSDFLNKAEDAASKKDRLRLVPIDDKRFTALRDKYGNTVYHLSTIPAAMYPNLQKGWFFGNDVKTLTVQAVLVLRNEWADTFGSEAMDALSATIIETRPTIKKMVNG